MKTGPIIAIALAALVAGGVAYQDPTIFGLLEQDAKAVQKAPRTIPGSYIGDTLKGEDWADTAKLANHLGNQILAACKSTDKANAQAFIAKPENRLMLAQWFVANRANQVNADEVKKKLDSLASDIEKRKKGIEDLQNQIKAAKGTRADSLKNKLKNEKKALKERQDELASPRSAKDALAKYKHAATFYKQLTNNLDRMEQIAYSGECSDPGRALAILAAIAEKDQKLAYREVPRKVAAATAVEWARSGWNFGKALDRAGFYMENWEDGRFNPDFDKLPFWMLRMVCGSKGDNDNGSVESLEWALDNVHLPTGRYSGCCWQAAYRLHNWFGDSIHGPHYYAPYADYHGHNAVQRTYDVGGVCGSLSHFGAFSALANGVPAMTAGEPGHCAYIVWSNNKWQPGYSLSWKRGLHWPVWKGVYKFATLHMQTELQSEKEAPKTRLADVLHTLGLVHAAAGDNDKALACLRNAVEAQPLHFIAWRDYAATLAAHAPNDAAAWKRLNDDLSASLAPRYPENAAELLKANVYPQLAKAEKSHDQLMGCFASFWRAVDEMGPDRWDIEALCDAQVNALKATGKKQDEAGLEIYGKVLGLTAGKAKYAPPVLSWGNGMAAKLDAKAQQKFLHATVKGLGKGGGMKAEDRDKMLGQALQGAEKMRDLHTFQAIGKLLSEKYRKNTLPKFEPFPGKLVSQGGLLYTSSSSHDDPPSHWGVLEPTGGRFHTNNEENPWAVVQLPRTAVVSGVVAISTSGQNVRRLHDMKVQYSESGKDDDWHDAGAFPAPSTKAVNRLDLKDSKPRARFIRIIRGGGKDFFHLNAILVYGELAA